MKWREESPDIHRLHLDRTDGAEIVVHRFIGDKENWYLSCHALKIDRHVLEAQELRNARFEAIMHVRIAVLNLYSAITKAYDAQQSGNL